MEGLATVILFSILGMVVYTYVGYPAILSILRFFRKSEVRKDEGYTPSVVLMISVHNEERIIREKLENSLSLNYPADKFKIVVASDGSDDSTNDIVRLYEKRGVTLKKYEHREGKSATLNKAILGLEADVIVFSDANAFYKEDAIRKLVRNLADERVGCVVGRLLYLPNHSFVGKGESLYWRYESFLNELESSLGSVLVGTGTIFALRKELFRPLLKDVANDFQVPAEVASKGYKVVFEPEAIAWERATSRFSEEFNRKRRIIVRGLTGFRALHRDFGGTIRYFQFVSRKLIRWLVGPMLPVLYVSNLVLAKEPAFLALFVLQNAFYFLAGLGALLRRGGVQFRMLFVPLYFVMVNAASLAAVVTYLCGDRMVYWEKAETTRELSEREKAAPVLRVIEGNRERSMNYKEKKLEKIEHIT